VEAFDLPNCCGVVEFGELAIKPSTYSWEYKNRSNKKDWEKAFQEMKELAEDHPAGYYQVWFHKPRRAKNYVGHHLAKLIAAIPGVIELEPVKNPNSGNMIKGYIWKKF
jgi:hypothetical protein